MQQLTLIKHHQSVQLAHLYEHLFSMQVRQLFYDHGLFKYLDYGLQCRTYEPSGLIEVELDMYSSRAIELSSNVRDITVPIDEQSIGLAYTQLVAEERLPIHMTSESAVARELKNLNSQSWRSIDTVDSFDEKTSSECADPLYITDGKQYEACSLKLSVTLVSGYASDKRHLLPLFRQMSKLISFTLQDRLTSRYGFYADSEVFKDAKHITTFSVAHHRCDDVNLDHVGGQAREEITHMIESDAFTSYAAELRRVSYGSDASTAPDAGSSFIDTGIYLGERGWRHIATDENLHDIWDHMQIDVRMGDERVNVALPHLQS